MAGWSSVFLVLATCCVLASSYKFLDRVPVLVNTVGPLHNPAETYPFYTLPFCAPKDATSHSSNLGESLSGDRKKSSLYDIRFKVDIQWQSLCSFKLTQDDIKSFLDSIKQDYIFELFVDSLSVQGFVGESVTQVQKIDSHFHNRTRYFLFTHLDFSIAFNGDNVIAVNVTTDPNQRLEINYGENLNVEFSYSARWWETQVPFENRLELHAKSRMGIDSSLDVHWLSMINSFVLVMLLTAFLAIILIRVLRNDVARYLDVDDEDLAREKDESGWKQVHGDVFRVPPNIMLFTSCLGTGVQILVMVCCVLVLALFGFFYPGNRGALYTAAIILYALTSGVAGYVSASLYASFGGEKWATNAVLTACLFAAPFFATFAFINTVAVVYRSSTAIPFTTILLIILLWALVTFPLTVAGALRGKQDASKFDAPCKPTRVPREIPPIPWYRTGPVQVFLAGFLPFSAIYIELHYIFAAVWGHHVYTVFGILTLAFTMLLIVTSFVTVSLTYFQLAIEDHRWWWRSFFSAGSTGFFILAYGAFFFFYRSSMTGFLQGTFFFGYMLMISYAFFLMLGAVGYFSSLKFVKHIYQSIKSD